MSSVVKDEHGRNIYDDDTGDLAVSADEDEAGLSGDCSDDVRGWELDEVADFDVVLFVGEAARCGDRGADFFMRTSRVDSPRLMFNTIWTANAFKV